MCKDCEKCIWYEHKVSDEYYVPETGDYTWWWYHYCKWYQRTIEDTVEEVCHHYTE